MGWGQKGQHLTPSEYFDILAEGVPATSPYELRDHYAQGEIGQALGAYWGDVTEYTSPRTRLKLILKNMAVSITEDWHGPTAVAGAVQIMNGANLHLVVEEYKRLVNPTGDKKVYPFAAFSLFTIVSKMFAHLAVNEFGSAQPTDRPTGLVFCLGVYGVNEGGNSFFQMKVSSRQVTAQEQSFRSIWSDADEKAVADGLAVSNYEVFIDKVGETARVLALEHNRALLETLVENASAASLKFGGKAPSSVAQDDWNKQIGRCVDQLDHEVFKRTFGSITHLIAGPDACVRLAAAAHSAYKSSDNPDHLAGLTRAPFTVAARPNLKIYKAAFWGGSRRNTVLAIRRGLDFFDTPYVGSPYSYSTGVAPKDGVNAINFSGSGTVVDGNKMAILEIDPESSFCN